MKQGITISLCMIVKDEEDVIERCIRSVLSALDEIIIVDTGSNDRTKEIALSLGATVYDMEWQDNFGLARNFAFSKATKDYIMWLDADDIMTEDNLQRLLELKKNLDNNVDSVTMTYVLAEDSNGNPTSSLRRNRLVKREKGFQWIGKIHEYLAVHGNIINADASIHHRKIKSSSGRNLRIYKGMIDEGEELSVRDMFYYANELFYNGYHDEAIEQYSKFLDTKAGWIEDVKTTLSNMSECYSAKEDTDNQLKCLLRAFEYDVPRSDFCCKIAYCFFHKNMINNDLFCYNLAIETPPDKDNLSLVNHSTYTWIPNIQLCVCYSRLEEYDLANEFNEKAGEFIPDDPMIIHNRNFLRDKISKD
ncbi:glycosyltransferase [Clostridium sp.]|uniref:glycosyltransferase n=1 Tax=Clostridium sp. TaxID=1506 RepID=UPI003464CBBC